MVRKVIGDVLKEVGMPVASHKDGTGGIGGSGGKDKDEESSAVYVLKESLEQQFDPTFWHASSRDRQSAIGEIAKKRKRKRHNSGAAPSYSILDPLGIEPGVPSRRPDH